MKKLFSYFSYLPQKLLAGLAVIALVAVPLTMTLAEGRPTMPYEGPGTPGADHVVFNSFTGVPNVGDERNFLHGKIAGAEGGFTDPVNVSNNDEVLVRVYVHNNADSSLNESGEGIAKNTRVRVELPEGLDSSQELNGYISADNAMPETVTDNMKLQSGQRFEVDYVSGSATIKTNFMDKQISDDIVDGGVLIGDDKLDGKVNGCFEYVALVTFKVKIKSPKLDVVKEVRQAGQGSFHESMLKGVKPGDKLEYRITFKNTGKTSITDPVVGDTMPEYVRYVSDSAVIYNENTGPAGRNIGNAVVDGGVRIKETYKPGAVGIIVLEGVVEDSIKDSECGLVDQANWAAVRSEDSNRDDDYVTVKIDTGVDCEPDEPIVRCDSLVADTSILKIGENVNFTANATAENGATVESYSFNYGDGSADTVDSNTASHTYTDDGTYTATVDVNFLVDGEQVSKSGQNCKVVITVEKEPVQPTYSCKMLSVDNATPVLNEEVIFTVDANAENGASVKQYRFDFGDGSDVFVTDDADVAHSYDAAGQYDVSVEVVFDVNGEMKTASSADCALSVDVQPATPVVTPEPETETPEELPNTGAAEALMAITGTGAIGQAVSSYTKSRKGLRGVLKDL